MKSKIIFYSTVIFVQVIIANIIVFAQNNNDISVPVPVTYVDLDKYSGLWYELAKIPNSFQDHCAYGTTAEYKIMPDGDIIVIKD